MQIGIRNRKWSISFDKDYLKTTTYTHTLLYFSLKIYNEKIVYIVLIFFLFLFFTDPLSDNNLQFQQCRKIIELEFFLATIRSHPIEIEKFGRRACQAFTNIREKQSHQEIAHRGSARIRRESGKD